MILLLVVALASCKKTPEVNLKYVDVERDLVTVGTTTANIQCDYAYIATLKKAYLYYGESENEDAFTSAEMRVVQNTLYVELTGLKANTTYCYYYEFHNGFNSMRTALKNFKTEVGNGGGEEPPTPEITLPTVITASVTDITSNSAKSGGEVINDGGAEVTERGICWSTGANPTINNSHASAGTGMGSFSAMMSGLSSNTTYHVRAYATNEVGTAYGLDKEFTTLEGGGSGNVPEGAINGLFTINENGDKVYFSQGNLQYIGSAAMPYWKFAENQWDYFGETTGQNSANQNVDRDLFGWGTSGWNNGNLYYQPYDYEYMTVWNAGDFGYGYGPTDGTDYNYCLTGNYANADWGIYNAISNGGNTPGQWRTLTGDEWGYVFDTRSTASGIRFAMAKVNNVNGVILLPDDWSSSYYTLSNTNTSNASFSSNTIMASQWSSLDQHGAVFLPAAGYRNGTSVLYVGSFGYYWSVWNLDSYWAHYVCFYDTSLSPDDGFYRYYGRSVRLVAPVEN